MLEVGISSPVVRGDELRAEIERASAEFDWPAAGLHLVDHPRGDERLRVEPITVALVLSAPAVVALIKGLSSIVEARIKTKGQQKIVFVGPEGRRLEVPAGTSVEEIDQYIERLKELDAKRIELR